jgi:alpha-mannosidase
LQVIGHGDGGGGPTPAMIERIKRMNNVDGLPKISFGSPSDFFQRIQKQSNGVVEWKGELVSTSLFIFCVCYQ